MDFCKCENVPKEFVLGIATVPEQKWETPCAADVALKQGTVFPWLNLPFYAADEAIGGNLIGGSIK